MRSSRTTSAAGLTGLALAAAILAPTAFASPAFASPAHAVTGAEQIVEACGSVTVCLYDGASISDPAAVTAALPQGVRVVVIPQPDQAQSVQSTTLAAELRSATGADTVIVIEDRPVADRFAVASNRDATAITESLYSQGQADGGDAVVAAASTLAPGSTPAGAPGIGGGIAVAAIAAALVAAAIGGAVLLLVRRGRRGAAKRVEGSRRLQKELAGALHGDSGELIRESIERLHERAQAYPDIGSAIEQLARHVSELFIRVRKRGADQQARLLQSQYRDTLAKLLKALDDDYYGDILRNPQYWSSTEQRLAEVRGAVAAVDQEAVENIRQVNESRDLEFKVALDSLSKTVTEAKLSDVYTDREQ